MAKHVVAFFFSNEISSFCDLLRVPPIVALSVLLNQTIILNMIESKESMTTVQTGILLFKSNFFKCETSRPVHFTKDIVIHQPIDLQETWKRKPSASSLHVPIFSTMLSYQYLHF